MIIAVEQYGLHANLCMCRVLPSAQPGGFNVRGLPQFYWASDVHGHTHAPLQRRLNLTCDAWIPFPEQASNFFIHCSIQCLCLTEQPYNGQRLRRGVHLRFSHELLEKFCRSQTYSPIVSRWFCVNKTNHQEKDRVTIKLQRLYTGASQAAQDSAGLYHAVIAGAMEHL